MSPEGQFLLSLHSRLKLVEYRMEGRLAFYSIRDPFVLSLLDAAAEHYTERGAS